ISSQGLAQPTIEYTHNGGYSDRYNWYFSHDRRNNFNARFPYKLNPVTGDLLFLDYMGHNSLFTLSKIDSSSNEVVPGTINRNLRTTAEKRSQITFTNWLV